MTNKYFEMKWISKGSAAFVKGRQMGLREPKSIFEMKGISKGTRSRAS